MDTELSEKDKTMRLYYEKAFPFDLMAEWLVYGKDDKKKAKEEDESKKKEEEEDVVMSDDPIFSTSPGSDIPFFKYREFACMFEKDGTERVLRYRSFKNGEEMRAEFTKGIPPSRIEIGPIYSKPLIQSNRGLWVAVERELIFDIDMDAYDSVRYCCQDRSVCEKCWRLATTAAKIINRTLRESFGFKHLLWVFSGRRGIHCWVADERARKLLPEAREAIINYMDIFNGGQCALNEVLPQYDSLHPLVDEAYRGIIKPLFEQHYLIEQGLITEEDRREQLLSFFVVDKQREEVKAALSDMHDPVKMWKTLENFSKDAAAKVPQRIALTYMYPRFDANVTKGMNHLLKAPFSVHPGTGKISVPINIDEIDKFNPDTVPTITTVTDEIRKDGSSKSLEPSIEIFRKFVQSLAKDRESHP